MSGVTNPHDRFFRQVFSSREVVQAFAREYLPAEVAACLVLDSLEVTKESQLDRELRLHQSDLVCRVQLRQGRDAFLYLLFEAKSRPDQLVAFQLLRYVTRLWEDHLRQGGAHPLPPVIPLVLYHGRRRWSVDTEFSDLDRYPEALAAHVPRFRYLLTDLSRYPDDAIRGTVILRAALLALRHVFDPDLPERMPVILEGLRAVIASPTGLEAPAALSRYFSGASARVGERELRAALAKAFPREGDALMATFVDRLIEQGKRQSIQQGYQQGAATTAQESLLEVLEARFQRVPNALRARIAELAEVETLRALLKIAATAESLEDVGQALERAPPTD